MLRCPVYIKNRLAMLEVSIGALQSEIQDLFHPHPSHPHIYLSVRPTCPLVPVPLNQQFQPALTLVLGVFQSRPQGLDWDIRDSRHWPLPSARLIPERQWLWKAELQTSTEGNTQLGDTANGDDAEHSHPPHHQIIITTLNTETNLTKKTTSKLQ